MSVDDINFSSWDRTQRDAATEAKPTLQRVRGIDRINSGSDESAKGRELGGGPFDPTFWSFRFKALNVSVSSPHLVDFAQGA